MPLKTPIFKSDDPEFNHRAAQAAYELVMKMDEDEAREFTSIVVADVLEQTIEKNLRTLQSQLDRVVDRRISKMKRAVVSAVMKNDDPQAVEFAKALVEISKIGASQRHGYVFNENDFRRDPSSGRFQTKIRPTLTAPLPPRQAAALGIPEAKGLSREDRARFQDEYMQIKGFLQAVQQSSRNPGSDDVMYHIKEKQGGASYTVKGNGTGLNTDLWNPKTERVVGVSVAPTDLRVGGASFALTQALGANAGTSQDIAGYANTVDSQFGSFANDWTKAYDDKNTNARMFGRLESGSKFLTQVAPPGSKVQLAGAFGQFVGSHGPQAEQVIGPTARRTAYRYRGTEKKPDSHLVTLYDRALRESKKASRRDPGDGAEFKGRRTHGNLQAMAAPAAMQMAAQNIVDDQRTPTWEERRIGRDVLTEQMRYNLPDKKLYELQIASGNTPPSEGLLIDKNGKITTQAVGYGDDHYLPFNLKHLKDLRGGEYIRTRSVGGLTAEDVYTGLIMGARQVTVVSRSGTFTMQFDESFKGGRRYNDKALRMTRRYQQILDAVQSEQVERRDVSPAIRQMITQKVREEYPGEQGASLRTLVSERIKEYKETPELTDEDNALIVRMWERGMTEDPSRDADQYRKEIVNVIQRNKGFMFQLDGRGYEDALNALAEQFPYYISSSSKITEEKSDLINIERDKGYVEPGKNRPTAARAGLYGTGGKGNDGKYSASMANYQRDTRPYKGSAAAPADDPEIPEKPKDSASPGGGSSGATKLADAGKAARQRREVADAAVEMMTALRGSLVDVFSKEQYPFIYMDDGEFASWFAKPENQKALDKFLMTQVDSNDGALIEPQKNALAKYRNALKSASERPSGYSEPAYQSTATPELRKAEMKRLSAQSLGIVSDKKLEEMDGMELTKEKQVLEDILGVTSTNPEIRRAERVYVDARKQVAADLNQKFAPKIIKAMMDKDDRIKARIQAVERAIYLRKSLPVEEAAAPEPAAAPAKAADPAEDALRDMLKDKMGENILRLGSMEQSPARDAIQALISEIKPKLSKLTPDEAKSYYKKMVELEAQE